MTDHRKCLECGEKIVGRADKKFCSDYCRNAYHNRANSDANNLVRNINNALRRNRKALDTLCRDKEKVKTTRAAMLRLGFDFNYHTSQYTTKNGTVYQFCYELGYLLLNHDEVLIVRRQEA